jgi:hypothetical protein
MMICVYLGWRGPCARESGLYLAECHCSYSVWDVSHQVCSSRRDIESITGQCLQWSREQNQQQSIGVIPLVCKVSLLLCFPSIRANNSHNGTT